MNSAMIQLGELLFDCDRLTMLEAMSSGLPVIMTGAGAGMDFATPETAYLIPSVKQVCIRVIGQCIKPDLTSVSCVHIHVNRMVHISSYYSTVLAITVAYHLSLHSLVTGKSPVCLLSEAL